MSNTMTYKGYAARIEYDDEDEAPPAGMWVVNAAATFVNISPGGELSS